MAVASRNQIRNEHVEVNSTENFNHSFRKDMDQNYIKVRFAIVKSKDQDQKKIIIICKCRSGI